MSPSNKRKVFYTIYFALLLLPVVAMLLSGKLTGNFVREFALLIGFLGMALAGIQLIFIGKIRWLADALDLDKVYSNHHKISLVAVFLIVAHFLLVSLLAPVRFGFLNVFSAPWMFAAGSLGLFGLVLIGITSAYRKNLKIDYRVWLLIHDLLTIVILVFGMTHLFKVDYYMADPFVRAVWYLEIAVWVVAFLYIRVIKPIQVGRKPYKVVSVLEEAPQTYGLNLVPDGHAGVPFRAGQIAWISTGPSPFTLSRNPFSYSGSSEAPNGAIRFSIKVAGDFTASIPNLKPGDRVYVDGPYGTYNLDDPALQKGVVLIAGGIGVAPVMSIMNTLTDRNDNRPVYVFYGDLNEDTALYPQEFEHCKSVINLTFVQVLEKPHDPNYPFKGYITKDLMLANLPENYKELHYFICGPAPMLRALEKHFAAMEIPQSQIHLENYTMA